MSFSKVSSKARFCDNRFQDAGYYGEPRYGVTGVYSYGDRGNGLVFLINPGMLTATTTLMLAVPGDKIEASVFDVADPQMPTLSRRYTVSQTGQACELK